ncbi:MAG: 2-hydroxyhepta-2,4-diene-1,7-dioate isomerase, partial [Flavobacteriaceae bacterium]
MLVYNTKNGILIQSENLFYLLHEDWDDFINNDNLSDKLSQLVSTLNPIDNAKDIIVNHLLVPMQSQELWASG